MRFLSKDSAIKNIEPLSLHFRRVAKKVAFCVISKYPCKGMRRDHEPLPISPNRLSAGRTLRVISAQDFLPSGVGVTKGNFFGRGFEPSGSYLGQRVTRHPSLFSPRRFRRWSHEMRVSSTQTFLSKTGSVPPPAR